MPDEMLLLQTEFWDYKNNFHFEQLSPNDYECSNLCTQNTYTGAFIRGEMSAQKKKIQKKTT